MSDRCCLEQDELDRLRDEQRQADEEEEHDREFLKGDPEAELPFYTLDFAWEFFEGARPVWLSAACEDAGMGCDPDKRPGPSVNHLLRDALAQLSHVLLGEMKWPLVVRWDPMITPALLDGAMRFGPPERTVWVLATDADLAAREQLQVADWRRGKLIHGATTEQSRREFLTRCPLRGMILMGGGRAVQEDADAVLQSSRLTRRFAIGSTGATAQSLFTSDPDLYSSGKQHLQAALKEPGSYLLLLRDIAQAL